MQKSTIYAHLSEVVVDFFIIKKCFIMLRDAKKGGIIIKNKKTKLTNNCWKRGYIEMKRVRLPVILNCINVLCVISSLVLSGYAIHSANKLAIYQVEQERLPSVVCLKQEIKADFETDYYDIINDYKSIDDIKLKIYNLGAGVAQNCEFTWDVESIKNACLQLKDELKGSVNILEFESKDFANQTFASYVYSYEFKDDNFQSIWYYDNELDDFIEHDFDIATTTIPYIMPITTEETNAYIKVPAPLAVMLLEFGNQEGREEVVVKLNINYQDMAGKEYSEELNISIGGESVQKNSLDIGVHEFREKNCTYTISAKKINK